MPTFTPKLPLVLRRAALLLPLLCLSWLAQAQSTFFNSGSLSYLTTGAADNRQVQFRVQQAYTILTEFRNPIVVGGVQTTATIDFGDGTAPKPVNLTVLSKGNGGAFSNNYFTGEFTTTHTYAAAGTYTAIVRGGGSDNSEFFFSTVVGAGAANDSPVPTPVPFVVLDRRTGTVTYQVPASDPNGDALTYSLATSAEIGSGFTNPTGLSIDPRTGLLSFTPERDADAVRIYTVVVKVSDGTASTLLYQRLDLVGATPTNKPPVFTGPTPNNGVKITVYAPRQGQTQTSPTSFTVQAADGDAGDRVTLQAAGLPPGATFTPTAPGSSNPALAIFSWTPTATTEGLYTTTFTAEDSRGAQTTTTVTFEVFGTDPPVFVAPTPPNMQEFNVVPGQTVSFTVKASDVNTYGERLTLRNVTALGLPPGATLTPSLPTSGNPVEATFSWTPNSFSAGTFDQLFEVQDALGSVASTRVRINVRNPIVPKPPVFVAPTPPNNQKFIVAADQQLKFTVRATDDDAGDIVTLRAEGLPAGSVLTPGPTPSGNPVETTFTWTPTAAQVGTYVVTFFGKNSGGGNTPPLTLNIQVTAAAACNPTATQPVAGPDQFSTCGGPIVITPAQLLANDRDPLGRPLQLGSEGILTNGTVVNNPDGTLTFTPRPGFTGRASFSYMVQLAGPVLASTATNHYYEFVSAPGICWNDARDAAAARSYQGLKGYLATVTSGSETSFLMNRNAGQFWLGGSDDAVEGEWRWKTGPEADQLFWRGGPNGTAVGYANWSPGEPNDYKNQFRPEGEDYATLYAGPGARWNDLSQCGVGASVAGYLVEYGGLEACTPLLYTFGTVTIDVAAPTPAPVANPDFYTYNRGPKQQLFLTAADLLRNDTDPLGRPLQVRDISTPSVGQFFVFQTGPTGEFTYNYSPPTGFVGQATFTYLLQLAGPVLALPATGHYYEYVSAPGICWADAQKAAATRSYQGMGGYLATITSAAETDFLKRFGGRNWFGASDDAVEGEWRWKTGPEAGQLFWRGGPDGTALSYARWSPGQPDNFTNQFRPAGEDYGMVYGGSGLWNDLANCGDGGPVDGYLVEYGGLEACTPVLYSIGTVTVDVPFSPFFTVVGASTVVQADGKSAAPATLEALPNPSDGQFRLRVTATTDGPAQLDLYDLQGRRVKAVFTGSLRAGEVRELSVEASELAAGIYLVRLQSGQQVQNLRVAIQK